MLDALLGKLLAPFVNHPTVRAIMVPTCAIATGVAAGFHSADSHTWQGKVALAAGVIVGICAAAGMVSTGVEPTSKPPLQSVEKPSDTPGRNFL